MAAPHSLADSPVSLRDFWNMLTVQEQITLQDRSTRSNHHLGDAIITEGVSTNRVTIVRSGWAKATVVKAGRPVLLRLYGPGEPIGLSAALTDTSPIETVTATSWALHAVSLPARSFADFLRCAPNASTALHRLQQRRLEESDRLRTIRDYPTAAQRLAGLLIELCRPENDPIHHVDGAISVPGQDLPQHELGSWIGDSRKTVVRALAELRRLKLTRPTNIRQHITIVAPDRLQKFAEAADAGRPTS